MSRHAGEASFSLVRSVLPHRHMDWWADDRHSVRLYGWTRDLGLGFCAAESTALYAVLTGMLEVVFGPTRQVVRATPGESCFVLGRTPYLYRVRPGTRFVAVDLPALDGPGVLRAAWSPAEGPVFARAWESPAPGSLVAANAAAERLLSRARRFDLSPAHSTARMLVVKRRLEEGLADPIVLGDLARAFRLDPCCLSRAFRASFGGTPSHYVRLLRMERFLRALRRARSEAALTRAALAAGFGDYPTLCRMTSRWFGAPPSRLLVDGRSRAPKPGTLGRVTLPA